MTAPVVSEARVPVGSLQQITGQDLTAIGSLAQGSLDNVVTKCLNSGAGYTGMAVSTSGTTGLVVAPGYLIKGGPAYSLRDPYPLDLSAQIAVVPDSSKTMIVLLVADGQESPSSEVRTFEDASKQPTNPADPWPTLTQATPTRVVRTAVISKVAGAADVQPQVPAYPAGLCLIATVVVSNTAIVSVTQEPGQQIITLAQLALIANGLTDFQDAITPVIAALAASVSALALKTASQFQQVNSDISKLQDRVTAIEAQLSAPQSILRGVDFFTDASQSNTGAAGYAAAVGQGLTFPPSTTSKVALAPQNVLASNVSYLGNRYLTPAYTEVTAAQSSTFQTTGPSVPALYFNNYGVFATTFAVRDLAYWRVRWGGALAPLSVAQLIAYGNPDLIFPVVPGDLNYQLSTWGPWYNTETELLRLQGYWRDLASRGTWSPIVSSPTGSQPAIVQNYTPQGAVMVTSFEVGINRVGSSGDVRLVMTKSNNGRPDPTQTLGDVTVPFSSMGQFSTKFTLPFPTLVKGGETVHFVIYTSGGHSVRYVPVVTGVVARAFFGPILVFAAGGWVPVDTGLEIAGRINVAQFKDVTTRIPANVLALAGGIDTVDISAKAVVPDGCSIDYEGQIAGQYVSVDEVHSGSHPLAGRPTTLPINIILSNTRSVAPVIDLNNTFAQVSHQSTAFLHQSSADTPPVNAKVITKSAVIDRWNGTYHTLTASLQTGTGYTTANAPTAVTDQVQPDGSLLRTWTWAFGSASIATAEFQLNGATSDSTKVFSVRQANFFMST